MISPFCSKTTQTEQWCILYGGLGFEDDEHLILRNLKLLQTTYYNYARNRKGGKGKEKCRDDNAMKSKTTLNHLVDCVQFPRRANRKGRQIRKAQHNQRIYPLYCAYCVCNPGSKMYVFQQCFNTFNTTSVLLE